MKTRTVRLLVLALVAAIMVGSWACQKKAQPITVPESANAGAQTPPPPPPVQQPSAEPFPPTDVDKAPVVEPTIDQLNRDGVLRTVYFAFNSNELDELAKSTLQANANWLKSHAKYIVQIGGHCDERGSIGYNVALGDRRATAVKDYLIGLGVSGSQLVAISYGEERPADPGHDDTAWAKNRRAEFTITS